MQSPPLRGQVPSIPPLPTVNCWLAQQLGQVCARIPWPLRGKRPDTKIRRTSRAQPVWTLRAA
eukprot:2635723-Pyramimonas_sp.AAC.1